MEFIINKLGVARCELTDLGYWKDLAFSPVA